MTVKQNAELETDGRAERLGEELRALRKAHGLTLRALSEKSGKSISFISKIERGRARPSITALQDIAEALAAQNIQVERKLIKLDAPIKTVGSHEVIVRMSADVNVTLKVNVIGLKK